MTDRIAMTYRLVKVIGLTVAVIGAYPLHYLGCRFVSPQTALRRRSRLHRRKAAQIRRAALKLGGLLIKIGQFMSTRIDLLPEEYIEELAELQDQVPPVPFAPIRQRLEEEFGPRFDQIFERVIEQPIAAASLGQVHEAYLRDGRRVAVKVQYPGIEALAEVDLRAIRLITSLLQRFFQSVHFDILQRELERVVHEELDYLAEARNMELFHRNFRDDPRVVVPRVLRELTTQRVLTQERVEGIKINRSDLLREKGIDRKAVARLLVESYLRQILIHRFFHGDPHPGNLFVVEPKASNQEGPRLVFMDFGLMQQIPPALHEAVKRTIGAVIERDIPQIVEGMIEMGFIGRNERQGDIERTVRFFVERYRDMPPWRFRQIGIGEIAKDLREFFRVAPSLQIPNHFIVFGRAAGILNGLCSQLDPDLNIIQLAKPYALRFLQEEERDGIVGRIRAWGERLWRLPRALDRYLESANRGELRVRMMTEDLTSELRRLHRLAGRGILAFFTVGLIFSYGFLHGRGLRWQAVLAGGTAAVSALMLAWSWLRDRPHGREGER